MKWLHRLFNPHCEHCLEEEREKRGEKKEEKACKSCEILQLQLEIANREKELLLSKLLVNNNDKKESSAAEMEEFKPAPSGGRRFIPSVLKQQMIENEDRKTLQLMQDKNKEIAALEKEVLGDKNAS